MKDGRTFCDIKEAQRGRFGYASLVNDIQLLYCVLLITVSSSSYQTLQGEGYLVQIDL
jgi:hypothetical protein